MAETEIVIQHPWKVSLHGGHSGAYCDHAVGTLREVLESAVAAGYDTFGVSEHAPRHGEHLLYDEERALGWDVAKIVADFDAYAQAVRPLAEEFADRLVVLCGFETEAVPDDEYVEIMLGYRERYAFDYMVGSVHYVDEVSIDGPMKEFEKALEGRGGIEALAVAYYRTVAAMVSQLKPEVVGHLDLIRRNAPSEESVETPLVRRAAEEALESIRENEGILDLNTAGYRKGLGRPYPAPWLLSRAADMGIGVCFGDDSHGPSQVGAGIDDARAYLLENGWDEVTVLTRESGEVIRKTVSLNDSG